MNPIKKFKQWYNEEMTKSLARIPSACCLSTIGKDGYPNARFVSLKEIIDDKFVITGPLQSRKGKELNTDRRERRATIEGKNRINPRIREL